MARRPTSGLRYSALRRGNAGHLRLSRPHHALARATDVLQLPDEEKEERQCMVIHVAAAVLLSQRERDSPGAIPEPDEVCALASEFRDQLWTGATEAARALGEPPERMDRAEQELRG